MSLITELPDDIIIDCVSRLPRCYYPTLSLVSKFFRSLIVSPQLYATRALMDRTECFLYATISLTNNIDGITNINSYLYTLRRKHNSTYSLVPITSLPHRSTLGSYVAVDSNIFVMGGSLDVENSSNNSALLIDCRYHTARNLPNMPKEAYTSMSGLVNDKIYVCGNNSSHCPFAPDQRDMDLMVFDIKSETWESIVKQDIAVCNCKFFGKSAVTWDNKIYFNCFVYDTKKDKWEKDEILNSRSWYGNGCVMEGVLYYYSPGWEKMYAYDFKQRCWKVVKGVERLMRASSLPRTVIYDKKVVLLFVVETGENREIWCAVIEIERDQEGEFCGIVEWCGCVLDNGQWPYLTNCLPVKV